MLKMFRYFRKKEWLMVFGSLVFVVGQVWLDLRLPDYMSDITTFVMTEGSTMSDVLIAGAKMLFCALGSVAFSCIVGFFAAQIAAGLSKRLRSEMFSKVSAFSMEEINGFSTASLITRSTNDITQVQMAIAMGLQVIIKAPILAVWAILKILGKSWQWTAVTGGAVVVLVIIIGIVVLFAMPKFKMLQVLTDDLNRVTRENLTGIRVVRAYNAENYQMNKFDKSNKKVTSTLLFATRIMAIMRADTAATEFSIIRMQQDLKYRFFSDIIECVCTASIPKTIEKRKKNACKYCCRNSMGRRRKR